MGERAGGREGKEEGKEGGRKGHTSEEKYNRKLCEEEVRARRKEEEREIENPTMSCPHFLLQDSGH